MRFQFDLRCHLGLQRSMALETQRARSRSADDRHVVVQAGAVCTRNSLQNGETEILLISSLSNGDWGIPKGHLESGECSAAAAAREAFEEAGMVGEATPDPIGTFTYLKPLRPDLYCVRVHMLAVTAVAPNFPERDLRIARWVPASHAAAHVNREGLRIFLSGLFRSPRPCV